MSVQHDPAHAPSAGHERRDITPRPIVFAGLGLVVVVVALAVLMRVLFGFFAVRESTESSPGSPLAGSYGRSEPPAPRLQARPILDLQALRAEEAAALQSYGWIDRDRGIVRIPIERAMALLTARGLPAKQAFPEEGGR